MKNRNEAHFKSVPGNFLPHSKFDLSHDVLTSCDVGQLIPMDEPLEVLPDDIIEMGIASEIHLNTLIFPIMDNLFVDVYHFYTPFRILWDNYTKFEGENDSTPWTSETTYSIPQVESPDGGWECGTLADYMGIPINIELKGDNSIGALEFRGYAAIVKDWFYDENVQTPPDVLKDDATLVGSNGDDYVVDLVKGGKPFVVGKTHDVFTSCLPAPQKGPSVVLPLGDNAPIYTGDEMDFDLWKKATGWNPDTPGQWDSLKLKNPTAGSFTSFSGQVISNNGGVGVNSGSIGTQSGSVIPTNLYADLSLATQTTVNDLRLAFQTQRLFELMARSGSNRYYEILAAQWGVSAPAGLIQRTEYLGGSRFKINIQTSVQNSATDNSTPQANLAGYSISTNYKFHFKKGFSERGFIYTLFCVRYHHSYSQGIPKTFKKKDRYDFYNNVFAHIGEQPVYNYEIYAQGNSEDMKVFGYNEYGIDYRYRQNRVSGQMRPQYSQSLSYMHLGDNFSELPKLTSDFIKEDKTNVDRVIAVSSRLSNQVRCNFFMDIKAIRPMPIFATPGLIDHL